MAELYRLLAVAVDLTHAAAMLAWGVGLPLLFWHRFERLSHVYTLFAVVFVVTTVGSHVLLGECFLTRLARELWWSAGALRDSVPFTVVLTNAIAGIRPSSRSAVWLWEAAVLVTSLGSLWSWHRARSRTGARLGSSDRPQGQPGAEVAARRVRGGSGSGAIQGYTDGGAGRGHRRRA